MSTPVSLNNVIFQENLIIEKNDLQETDKKASTFALKLIPIKEGEKMLVEPGAMLACQNLHLETKTRGFFNTLKIYLVGGETLFINHFTGKEGGGWLGLEEQYDGQIVSFTLKPEDPPLTICHGAFLATTSNVNLTTRYEGLKGWLMGKGFGTIKAEITEGETAQVYLNTSEGQVKVIPIDTKNIPVIIDNNHILGYTSTLENSIGKIDGLKSFIFSGEGLVCKFKGKGVVLVGSGAKTGTASHFTDVINGINRTFFQDILPKLIIAGGTAATLSIGYYIRNNYLQDLL